MTPDPYLELCELYALGALDEPERTEFEHHLAGCAECREGMQRAIELNEMILSATPRVQPRPELRNRILNGFGQPARSRAKSLNWAMALALAAALILAIVHWRQAHQSTPETAELLRLREIQQILQSSGGTEVTFGPQPTTPHGRILIQKNAGMILIAEGLAPAPEGWAYESWVIPKEGAPIPMEAFRVQDGRGISLLKSPLPPDRLKAVAVSLEPAGAAVKTPTKVIFGAPLG